MAGGKNRVEYSVLAEELEQLGTPREHAGAISRVYRDNRDELEQYLQKISLRFSRLNTCQVKLLNGGDKDKGFILDLEVQDQNRSENRKIALSELMLRMLKNELKTARESIEMYQL
ncbi:COMM domain-containing protein 4 [Eurytemora carolleeae]|uniref:COMM domain-containing protein 4 n=1 Tax=Eurytemora carolleeae TaxID=1294199 RepID=UPI000C773A31|nr:COMM domain-containing protein 4 [Eurytemora carolleeae]|eukprot:XP_023333005.1 COMM domain-containing protein 4-like [Eurytemora affinis]